jgi:hypothetical protein
MSEQIGLFDRQTMSRAQDTALSICLATKSRCDHCCTRDGAPNCHWFVVNSQCEPGRQAMARLYGRE